MFDMIISNYRRIEEICGKPSIAFDLTVGGVAGECSINYTRNCYYYFGYDEDLPYSEMLKIKEWLEGSGEPIYTNRYVFFSGVQRPQF